MCVEGRGDDQGRPGGFLEEAGWREQPPRDFCPLFLPVSVHSHPSIPPLLLWVRGVSPSPRTAEASPPSPTPTPTPLGAHLLQRPWDRCTLLPAVLGREHF